MGLVLVLFKDPNGDVVSLFGWPLSGSLSSKLGPKVSALPVLRLRSDGGGEVMPPSSFENLLLLEGLIGLLDRRRSFESLRLPPGRADTGSVILWD